MKYPGPSVAAFCRTLACAAILGVAAPAAAQSSATAGTVGIVTWSDSAPAAVAHGMLTLPTGENIGLARAGAGPAVVIVPGLLGSDYGFRRVIPQLTAAGLQVLVVDPLGMGRSGRPADADYTLEAQAARVEAAMRAQALPRATLLCHSVGASICYRLALRAPELVEGVVSVNGGPDEAAATDGLRFAMKFAPLIRILGRSRMRGRLRDGMIKSSAEPGWVTDEVVDAYAQPFSDLNAALDGLRGMAAARETAALAPRLPRLDAPVLLLVGAGNASPAIEPAALAVLQQGLPDFQVEQIAGAGQYVQEEQPAALVDAVLRFRRRLSAR